MPKKKKITAKDAPGSGGVKRAATAMERRNARMAALLEASRPQGTKARPGKERKR